MSNHFTSSPELKALRLRLWGSSLGVIAFTLGAFGVVVYQVVAQGLEQKSDRQLRDLADAAAHSLLEIAANPNSVNHRAVRTIDEDGDLDIPWQDLRQEQQAVEWFNANEQLLARTGRVVPPTPLSFQADPVEQVRPRIVEEDIEEGEIHRLTIPVYESEPGMDEARLQGYVRVSESNHVIEEELARLRSGLQWGSLLALILSGVGGWWLTQQSLQPIDYSIRQLKQFTADASHELRNPLTAIKASVEVMQSHEERFQASDVMKLEAIASATNQMSQLVDDLLWLARSDRLVVPTASHLTIPLTELLEEVLDQHLSQAEQKHIVLKTITLEDCLIMGDPFQLKRLFSNLITNALHYTPSGGTVSVSSEVQDDEVIVQIIDTGIGISPEHLPFVFDRFWRVDVTRTRQQGGSGLGLAIAQAIAHQHHGQITVHSQLMQGSCFQVELPIV